MNDSSDDRKKIEELIESLNGGNSEAMNELMPLIYGELRRWAHAILWRERRNHTLRTTALVHEAYIAFADSAFQNWKNRIHFIRFAAKVMRNILIEHARKRMSLKRGAGCEIISMSEGVNIPDFGKDENLIRLDEVLIKLEEVDKTQAEVIEHRFFAGLTIEETAQVMDIAPATVKRKWQHAQAWLFREMKR